MIVPVVPWIREHYNPGYYTAFMHNPNGHRLEPWFMRPRPRRAPPRTLVRLSPVAKPGCCLAYRRPAFVKGLTKLRKAVELATAEPMDDAALQALPEGERAAMRAEFDAHIEALQVLRARLG